MPEYLEIHYLEGGSLVDGWHYRLHRATKSGGEKVYTGLLSMHPQEGRGSYSFVCLAEYSSLRAAREAAYSMLPPRVQARILGVPWCRPLWPEQALSEPPQLETQPVECGAVGLSG